MSFTPTSGPTAVLKTSATGGTPAVIAAINWKITDDPKLKDVSNFAVGRFSTPTLADADIEFTVVWDQTAMPHDPSGAGLVPGADIHGKFYTDATHYYDATATVGAVEPGVDGLEDVVMYPVKAKLKGTLTRPSIP